MAEVLPIITFILGFGAKFVSDWVDAKRLTARERQARRDKIYERRNELQRQYLLEIQEVATGLTRSAGAANFHDTKAFRQGIEWKKAMLPDDLDAAFAAGQAKMMVLAVRIHDEQVRDLAMELRSACTSSAMAQNESDGRVSMLHVADIMETLNSRIGAVFRELDEVQG